nr:unnamed protein product [Anser cygnoides domesticus]
LLPSPKPVVISQLEEGEDPWIPDLHGVEDVTGDLSAGEVVEERRRLGLAKAKLRGSEISPGPYYGHYGLVLDFLCHPAGDRIPKAKETLQKSGMAQRQLNGDSVGKIRRGVQKGLEHGKHLKKPLKTHPGNRARNPLDGSKGQKEPKELTKKQGCQKKMENQCDECGRIFKSHSHLVKHQRIHT